MYKTINKIICCIFFISFCYMNEGKTFYYDTGDKNIYTDYLRLELDALVKDSTLSEQSLYVKINKINKVDNESLLEWNTTKALKLRRWFSLNAS